MSDDLVAFLRARLDEDERIARAASWTDEANAWHAEPSPFGARHDGQRWYVEDGMEEGVVSHVDPAASDDEGVARHIAEWDPARVLREIDADRALVAVYEAVADLDTEDPEPEFAYGRAAGLGEAVRFRALRYADRPGYREEWRP